MQLHWPQRLVSLDRARIADGLAEPTPQTAKAVLKGCGSVLTLDDLYCRA
jgi:hypothetical protein